MATYGTKDYEFDALMDAVLNAPWIVKQLVAKRPSALTATNRTGETVIDWFVVENRLDTVRVLCDFGARISPAALADACGFGHVEMAGLVLCYGVKPELEWCRNHIRLGKLKRRVIVRLCEVFRKHDYPLVET